MEELLPGIFHWSAYHEGIGHPVQSAYITATEPPVLIDPMLPGEGIEWFEEHGPPKHVFLTNRHHYRHSGRFAERFGATVWCHRDGLHEFTQGEAVEPFEHGDELPGGILALPVAALCPEETALYAAHAGGVLAIGDALIRDEGELCFVPDAYMGDDPEAVKQGLLQAFRRLLEREFDHLLLAHGEPWIGGARDALRRFVEGFGP